MNNIEELKKAALGANLHGWTGFEDALNDDGYSEAVSKFIGHCRPSEILALIAQLEAAQKERGVYATIYEDVGAIITLLQGNEWAKHVAKTNMGGALEHEITRLINSITDSCDRAEKAEAALSAANEKLKGERVPDGFVMVPAKASIAMIRAGGKAAREYMEEYGGNSPRAIYHAMVAAALLPAGFTVEE
ncbi:hypothetical protein RSE70_004385 [Yersinia enterocolitica]|nr:hypothetical protein [Yersinia enterocolitica]